MKSNKTDLTLTCFRISNGALAAKDLPNRIKILNWGDNPSVKGNVKVGLKTLSTLPALQKQLGYDKVAIDYEHNTVPGTDAFEREKEPRKVAGFGVPEIVKDDGLYLHSIDWTPSGKENAREYIDLSPAVKQDKDGEVLFVHSNALCRAGAVNDLSFYNVSLEEKTESTNMDLATLSALVETQKTQINDLTAKITALTTKLDEKKEGGDAKTIETLTASVQSLETKLTTLSNDWKKSQDDLRKDVEKSEREDIQTAATAAGKVIPLSADEIAATPVATLKSMVAKLPVTVPLSARTPKNLKDHSAPDATAEKEKQDAAKIRARAHAIQAEQGIKDFSIAFNMATKELGHG